MAASFEKEENEHVYRQNFNTLPFYPNHLLTDKTAKGTFVPGHSPAGWYVTTSGTVRPSGSIVPNWSTFNYYRINNGDQNTGWIYSYGAGNPAVPNEHSTERALGSLISSSHRNIHFGVVIENNTGEFLSGLEIDYNGEMWRVGTNPAAQHTLTFSYAVNPDAKALRERTQWISQVATTTVDSLSFISPANNTGAQQSLSDAAIDGNNAANRVRINGKIKAQIAPGQVILLRWEDIDDQGNDHGLAIDNLIIKAIPEDANNTDELTENRSTFYNIEKKIFLVGNQHENKITIHDIAGRILFQETVYTNMVDLNGIIGNGVFIVRIGDTAKKLVF
jgi:hypothetical protein